MGAPRSRPCNGATWRSCLALALGAFVGGLAVELVALGVILWALDHC